MILKGNTMNTNTSEASVLGHVVRDPIVRLEILLVALGITALAFFSAPTSEMKKESKILSITDNADMKARIRDLGQP
jgi:hypothetical protein